MKKTLVILLLCSTVGMWADDMVRPLRVGLLLPLQAQAQKRDRNMDRFVDFYSGALLAVYEMQDTGQPVEIHTWDVGKSTKELEKVLNSNALNHMDMVIGPVYASQVRIMAGWCMTHRVKTLLPFSSDVPELSTNPYLLQFNPSYAAEAEAMVSHLAGREGIHCILVENDEGVIPQSVRELQQCIRNYAIDNVTITTSGILADSLAYYMLPDKENILLTNTERFANLRLLMPHVVPAAQGQQLMLLSRYAWQEETIILPQIYTTVFRQDVDTTEYNKLYHRFYSTRRTSDHPCYDLLGYDLMSYTLYSLQAIQEANGMIDEQDILTRYFSGVQSDIQMERAGEHGGYQNTHIHCIETK